MESIDTRYLLHKDDICNALNKNKGTSEKKKKRNLMERTK